jgi:hypothetical protein
MPDTKTKPKQALNGTDEPIINNPGATLPEGDKVSAITPAPGYDLINVPKESVPESAKPVAHSEMPDPTLTQAPNGTDNRIVNNPDAALPEGAKVSTVAPAPGYDLIDNSKEPVGGTSKPASHSEIPDPRLEQALNGSHAS